MNGSELAGVLEAISSGHACRRALDAVQRLSGSEYSAASQGAFQAAAAFWNVVAFLGLFGLGARRAPIADAANAPQPRATTGAGPVAAPVVSFICMVSRRACCHTGTVPVFGDSLKRSTHAALDGGLPLDAAAPMAPARQSAP